MHVIQLTFHKDMHEERNIFVTYKERREITERDMTNIMAEYGTIKRLKVQNKIHANNGKALICFDTKEEAQRAIADINQYPGWRASLYYSRYKIQENQEKAPSDANNSAEKKNRKKIQANYKKHDNNIEEIIVLHNIDANEMECHACGLKGHKIKVCQTKQNIYIVNQKKTVKSKLEIQEETQQYGNIKSIKVDVIDMVMR